MSSHFNLDNMYGGALERGDIVVYEDKKGQESPVLVLQDNVLNDGLRTVVCASIEPYKPGEDVFANEVLLKKDETGLGKDGICMLHKLCTVDRGNIVAKKGELDLERLQEVYEALDINLGRFRDKREEVI